MQYRLHSLDSSDPNRMHHPLLIKSSLWKRAEFWNTQNRKVYHISVENREQWSLRCHPQHPSSRQHEHKRCRKRDPKPFFKRQEGKYEFYCDQHGYKQVQICALRPIATVKNDPPDAETGGENDRQDVCVQCIHISKRKWQLDIILR